APLHVGHAGPERAVTFDAEGTLGDGPGVEHRIGVPDHQDPGATAAPEAPDHEVAELFLVAGGFVASPLDGPPTSLQPRLAQARDRVHAMWCEGAAVDRHPLAARA